MYMYIYTDYVMGSKKRKGSGEKKIQSDDCKVAQAKRFRLGHFVYLANRVRGSSS